MSVNRFFTNTWCYNKFVNKKIMNSDFLDLLKKLISFRSISTDPSYISEIEKIVEFIKSIFEENDFRVEIIKTDSNPVIFAQFDQDTMLPTALLYGHYDVQPASLEEGWFKDPFELTDIEDKLYARGIVDNKGQFAIHMHSIFELKKENKLRYNIKFILEGNEETGSSNLEGIIERFSDKLKSDFVIFSDGELTRKHPTIDVGFRGIANLELVVKTSSKDNHSGLYGGSIPNASQILSRMISQMYNSNGVLDILGLDNNIHKVKKEVIHSNKQIPFDLEEFKINTGVSHCYNSEIDFYSQTGFLTSAEITSLKSGYMGEGFRNAIPGSASAKINFRISPLHKVEDVINLFRDFVEKNTPSFAEYEILIEEKIDSIDLDTQNIYVSKVKEIASEVYKKEIFLKYCGAIVPVAGIFNKVLNLNVVSIGMGNEDCNMHGVNENFDKELLECGLEFSKKFFSTQIG